MVVSLAVSTNVIIDRHERFFFDYVSSGMENYLFTHFALDL